MGERHVDERIHRDLTGSALKRRGILRAAGIAVGGMLAGMAAKQAAAPVAADDGDPLFIGYQNTASARGTNLQWTGAPIASGAALTVHDGGAPQTFAAMLAGLAVGGKAPYGVYGQGFCGVYGNSTTAFGVYGAGNAAGVYGNGPNGIGVYGDASPDGAMGVRGYHPGSGYGVYGEASDGGVGAVGIGTTGYGVIGAASTGIGVYGHTTASGGTGAIGVLGQSVGATSIGVRGVSNLGIGVSGASNGNAGVFGTTTATGFSGLAGIVSSPGTAAFAGTATVPTAFAGFFTGDVFVNGNFTVNDPTKKHGAIAHPDGTHRILYSMESPESWIEDFGTGSLTSGHAAVTLDPDFAAIAEIGDYGVFLTPEGDCNGLYVTAKSAASFEVRELKAGSATLAFRYRVVARPKTTNKAARLAKFMIPDIKVPQPPAMQNVPTPPVPKPRPTPVAQPLSRPNPPAAAATVAAPSQRSGSAPGGTPNPTASPVQPAPPPRP